MEKQQIVSFIEEQLKLGKISKSDLLSVVNDGAAIQTETSNNEYGEKDSHSKNLIHIFYGIGAIIALIGVVILIGQNWNEIGFMGRLLVSAGIALVTYISALVLNKPEQKGISQVMFIISGSLAPLGTYVLLNQANINFEWPFQFYTAIILLVIFGYALWQSKKNILVLITIGYGSWAYQSLILKVFGNDLNFEFIKWSIMLLGFSYILISSGYKAMSTPTDKQDEREKNTIGGVLYGFGTLAILGAGISIGGVFDLIFIAFIFAAFYGSVYLRSRSMLVFASLFLMGHIGKLTSKYFVDSIGWPVALIVMGFLIIGVGYMTYNLNKKYISEN